MTIAAVSRPCVFALALAAMGSPLVSGAAPEGMDFEALQADAKRSFKDEAAPFLEAYCTNCQNERCVTLT